MSWARDRLYGRDKQQAKRGSAGGSGERQGGERYAAGCREGGQAVEP
ncbi:MAG: hypothetical protein RLY70_10 [Planctomycetota bacterium]|jgi:hypothetical protein